MKALPWKLRSSRVAAAGTAPGLVLILGLLLAPASASSQQADSLPPDSVAATEVYTSSDLAASGSFDFLDTMRRLEPSLWVEQVPSGALRPGLRSFHLRGLGPDHALVRINGVRRHSMAVVQTFGRSIPGSSGVDLNAIPRLALERVELHAGGSTARYGSGAVSGVLDLRLRSGVAPLTVEAHTGKHFPDWFDDDGWKGRVAANWGFELPGLGGTLNLTGEYLRRNPTSRAGPSNRDQLEEDDHDVLEQLDDDPLLEIAEKRHPVPQPTFHVGDGFYENRMVWGNYERPASEEAELYLWGGWSDRTDRYSNFFRRSLEPRSWPQIYPMGFLPTFDVDTRDVQVTGGVRGRWAGWEYDAFGSFARNRIDAGITNTLNTTLGPCLSTPCAPGEDGELGTSDDPGIPNQHSFYLGSLESGQTLAALDVERRFESVPGGPLTLGLGAEVRSETFQIQEGEPASYIHGGHINQYGYVPSDEAGAQGFPGWRPADARSDRRTSVAVHASTRLYPIDDLRTSAAVRLASYEGVGTVGAAEVAARYWIASSFALDLSAGLGYRIPGLATSNWSHREPALPTTTRPNGPWIGGEFSVDSEPARVMGARPLEAERTRHLGGGVEMFALDGLEITARGYFTRISDGVALSDRLAGPQVIKHLWEQGQVPIISVRYPANVLELDAYGVEVGLTYRLDLGDGHDVRFAARGTSNRVEVRDTDPPPILRRFSLGFFRPSTLGATQIEEIEHGRPTEAGTVSAHYRWRGLELSVRAQHFGELRCVSRCRYNQSRDTLGTWPSKATVDAEVGYRFTNGVEVSLGGQNLADVMPEATARLLNPPSGTFDNIFWPGSPYPWMNGRYLYLSTKWTLD